jgi:hypothetical protein
MAETGWLAVSGALLTLRPSLQRTWRRPGDDQSWRGRSRRGAVAEGAGSAHRWRTQGGKVECALDPRTYQKGIKISDAEMQSLDITGDTFHPEWNYTIKPRRS